ncbi:MAG: DUF2846 domain-containing protein [Pseudomonadota bacterium]
MRILGLFYVTLLAAVFAGCAAPVKKSPVTIKEATRGTAVIYFFRPEADQVDVEARPVLSIDNRPVGTLDHGTYTAVSLPPGVYKVSLVADPLDWANWNQSADLTVEDGATYYVALWHQNQWRTSPEALFGVGPSWARWQHRPRGLAAVQFELVNRDIAEYGLTGLRFLAPKDDAMTVR